METWELFYFAAKTTIGGYGRSGAAVATQEGFGRNDNNISIQSKQKRKTTVSN